MFQIKVCGVTTPDDALAAVAAGADALGLNFYPRSVRGLTLQRAIEIAAAIGDRAVKVGVFVNCPSGEMLEIAGACSLDYVQLHGDEPPAAVGELSSARVIRAFRLADSTAPASAYLDACAVGGASPNMVLVDAAAPGAFGGTSQLADWELIRRERAAFRSLPLILAGGLTPENVAAAIRHTRPAAVDVASGVESSPGRKSTQRMQSFVAAARAAFAANSTAREDG